MKNTLEKKVGSNINNGSISYTVGFEKYYTNVSPTDTVRGIMIIPYLVQSGEDKGKMVNWDNNNVSITYK